MLPDGLGLMLARHWGRLSVDRRRAQLVRLWEVPVAPDALKAAEQKWVRRTMGQRPKAGQRQRAKWEA